MKPDSYAAYINDTKNGLKKSTQIDGWDFCVQYRPYDFIILLENKGNMSGDDIEKRKMDLKGTAWFTITIKRTDNFMTPLRYDIGAGDEYNSRLNYYLNEASRDIRLVYGADTLPVTSYLFENNYNLAPQETIIAGFSLPAGENSPGKNMRISFVDKVFKTGIINAEFSAKTLNNIPNLVY